MQNFNPTQLRHPIPQLLIAAMIIAMSISHYAMADTEINPSEAAKTMHAKYSAIEQQLEQNQFNRPLVLESVEADHRLKGDIYAVVDYPLTTVATGLKSPDHWCDIMHLHLNTKYCHATKTAANTSDNKSSAALKVYIGKKTPEELSDASRVDFNYTEVATTPEYMQIMLNADQGPLGTNDYRIILEAVSLSKVKTFLHLTYSYSTGLSGRIAMQTYLATVGHGKVGFTINGKTPDGQPDYIGGVRGLMERNTMRYYLAIDSYLGATNAAPDAQLEKRLLNWFTATEKYPKQLHELDQNDYMEMKRAEYTRQQNVK
ncbi:hypothetical protein QN372_01895 [Undibacterium sp. RTI2.1]|uniref:hypothetical protein n=1 Tax=unclassified Undibacterium TaxID=2630295 RepID=UPI002AB3EA08|nr:MULTISPECIES: hypothetical protein [unclassified Undibacterium]MDY7536844.1 hypothetical protein [Undibacterium sp. 5I1]MEB0029491.1 hypothetical protein [Undibacterium sp. RTI2.1]MEB0115677.1 hypothetical protein [Undibacterium sp. RTI2.2]MEB0232000.1 hypothetical protein [Undibacterium sp. 10I3]MEB0256726.1 hypothetical protein [Undibacterium sp. 5I1]